MKLIIFILSMTTITLGDIGLYTLLQKTDGYFTTRLALEVIKEHKHDTSLVMSAFSVLPPLGQLALASGGQTKQEILDAIDLPDGAVENVFRYAITTLQNMKHVIFTMANKIYIDKDVKLNPKFQKLSKDVFDSEVENIDFVDVAKAVDTVNDWVEKKTNQQVKNLVSENDFKTNPRALLVNAIYFKGQWNMYFDVKETVYRDFMVTPVVGKKVLTMAHTAPHQYAESALLDAKILKMDYVGSEASFVVVLPNINDGLKGTMETLKTGNNLWKAINETEDKLVEVYLPKFKIETETDLTILKKLNINKLFTPDAQLYNLLDHEYDIHIGAAKQKVFIEIDENGTEAAAANVFIPIASSISAVQQTVTFKANHPFAFFVVARGLVLFNGIYRGN